MVKFFKSYLVVIASWVFLFSFLYSSASRSTGIQPKCTQGKINIVIVSKGESFCNPKTKSDCLYYPYVFMKPYGDVSCEDDLGELIDRTSTSYSLENEPTLVKISYQAYIDQHLKGVLEIILSHGIFTANCEEIFDPDVQCSIQKTGDINHMTYTLTIERKSS